MADTMPPVGDTEDQARQEDRFRTILARYRPYLGAWDEWAPVAYDKIPVAARAVMAHMYGMHDDSPNYYAHCALCEFLMPVASEAR